MIRNTTLDHVPNCGSGEPHLVKRTNQEIGLRRRAYILDVGKYPLVHSYLDKSHKNCRNQLRYREPVNYDAPNVEVPKRTQECRTRRNLDIMSQLEVLQKTHCLLNRLA